MNEIYSDFIALLDSHLNKNIPVLSDCPPWNQIYQLSKNHHVSGIIAAEIKKLPDRQKPDRHLLSYFNQRLGYTLQEYENKTATLSTMSSVLNSNQIKHIIVKGAVLRNLYPIPFLRTSSDTDLIVSEEEYEKTVELFLQKGFRVTDKNADVTMMNNKQEQYEIHKVLEGSNEKTNDFFKNPFRLCDCTDYTYYLKPEYSLLYVITHIMHHIKSGGAGIRMIMDADVIIRSNPEIKEDHFLSLCDKFNIGKSARLILSVCSHLFHTPCQAYYSQGSELLEKFITVVIGGGIFGYENGGIRAVYLAQSMGDRKQITVFTRVKAIFRYIFLPKEYYYNIYQYAGRYHILLPAAFFQRLFQGIFLRPRQSINSIHTILTSDEKTRMLNDIIKELES